MYYMLLSVVYILYITGVFSCFGVLLLHALLLQSSIKEIWAPQFCGNTTHVLVVGNIYIFFFIRKDNDVPIDQY